MTSDSKITVEIKRRRDTRVNVYVISDALSIRSKKDNGSNLNNIRTFTDLLNLAVSLNQEAKDLFNEIRKGSNQYILKQAFKEALKEDREEQQSKTTNKKE
jgi:hypothetical protein